MNITGGIYNRQKVKTPDENITRPTLSKVRMGVFNTLASLMDFSGKSFLDMYSGSGIMSLEALSRGFNDIVAIEKNKKVYSVIKSNFFKYQKNNNLKLFLGDSIKICQKITRKFDVIYIDPPYFSGIYEKSLDAVEHLCGGIVVLEHINDIEIGTNYKIIKQKEYGEKYLTFLSYNS